MTDWHNSQLFRSRLFHSTSLMPDYDSDPEEENDGCKIMFL